MITINASDSMGNIDAVAFGDSSLEFARILENESVVLISGRISKRDDRVSIFVDSITPLAQWVAKIAKRVTLHITNGKVLPNIKKSLASLPRGATRVELLLHSGGAVTKIRLGSGVELGATTATDMAALGIKMEIE
jgi:DNA polymerase III alpha subunit